MKYIKLLSNDNYMIVNKPVAKAIGLSNAVLLSNLCSLSDKYGKEFFFTQQHIADTSCICLDTVKKGIKFFTQQGILSVKKRGIPCRCYYSFTDKLDEFISKCLEVYTPCKLDENTTNFENENTPNYNISNIISNEINNNTILPENLFSGTKPKQIDFEKFKKQLRLYIPTYGEPMIKDFFNYWSEPNKTNTKMRYEMEKTWDLKRRLERWNSNNFKNKADNEQPKPIPAAVRVNI